MPDLTLTLQTHLAAPGTGWSMGSFGAIAEFHQDPGEPAQPIAPLGRVTGRGGIRLTGAEAARPVAYELTSGRPERWGHGVALCLPAAEAAVTRRAVLTELGPDREPLRAQDAGEVLFDMGLDQPQVVFCIRTRDPALLDTLRAAAGRSLFEPGNTAMGAILAAHPHRLALTALGRVEVYQKIGGPETGGKSPPGPHTHVLPNLLRAKRTHSANIALPEGLIPCAFFYPPNPLADAMGETRPFDAAADAAFARLFDAWGLPEPQAVKGTLAGMLAAGAPPDSLQPATREGRRALRVALRQRRQTHGEDPQLAAWIAHHDRPGAALADEGEGPEAAPPDRVGH